MTQRYAHRANHLLLNSLSIAVIYNLKQTHTHFSEIDILRSFTERDQKEKQIDLVCAFCFISTPVFVDSVKKQKGKDFLFLFFFFFLCNSLRSPSILNVFRVTTSDLNKGIKSERKHWVQEGLMKGIMYCTITDKNRYWGEKMKCISKKGTAAG